MLNLNADLLAALTPSERRAVMKSLTPDEIDHLNAWWPFWAHKAQMPPPMPWGVWLFLGGRGAGKTRAGAEWVNYLAATGRARRIGLIGETLHEARNVMVEGESGLLRPLDPSLRPRFEPSLRRLRWASGAMAELYSADDPQQLRGPQFDLVWADEFTKWKKPTHAFDMAQMALRLGDAPRMMVTTTPTRGAALRRLMADPATATTHAVTAANARHLPATFLSALQARYGGSALGRQEIEGEILIDDDSALFQRGWIDAGRVAAAPELKRIVVAVDPPVSAGVRSDACGIVVAGVSAAGIVYVLADRTVQGLSPAGWAGAVMRAAAAHEADAIVVETNQGGDLVSDLLRKAGGTRLRVKAVRARASKRMRADPVAMLYEQGRVRHVGSLSALEDEMCVFGGNAQGSASPDRVDALVWAVDELAPVAGVEPRVRGM